MAPKLGKLWVLSSIELVRVERTPHGHRAVETIELEWWRRDGEDGEAATVALLGPVCGVSGDDVTCHS